MPPDREHGLNPDERGDERALERELRDLGARLDYPPTPDLARAARRRIEEEVERAPRRGGAWASLPSLRWVAAAALVLMLAVPTLSPGVRSAVSDFFLMGGMAGSAGGGAGGGGQAVSDGAQGSVAASGRGAASGMAGAAGGEETLASAGSGAQMAGAASTSASDEGTGSKDLAASGGGGGAAATAAAGAASVSSGDAATACAAQGGCAEESPLGESLGLGEKIPLREARARSEAPILLPRSPGLGKPAEAYARGHHAPGFTFLYRARAVDRTWSGLPQLGDTRIGLILTQTPGDVGAAYLPGGTAEGAGLEGLDTVRVNGEEGYWIPASGESPEVARSAGLLAGVLLWELEGQALRLEADVSKERAVRIAESVR